MGNISVVKRASATVTQDASAEAVINEIRNGKWHAPIERIRRKFLDALAKSGDRKAAKQVIDTDKKKLRGVLWSGRFSRRANDALIKHSGLLCADLDGLGDQLDRVCANLATSPYLLAMFRSPTG